MKQKLKEYLDTIFADAESRSPGNRQLAELKEEMLQNLNEKYDDLLASGKTPAAAYNIAVTGVGDISDLLDSVTGADGSAVEMSGFAEQPKGDKVNEATISPEEAEVLRKYRERSAILTSVAVAMYILCVAPVLIIENVVGVLLMFLMIAAATALLIFNSQTKPKFGHPIPNGILDEDDDDDDKSRQRGANVDSRPPRSPVYTAISAVLWVLTVCGYLVLSFLTGFWHITWMMFLITAAVDNIIKAIFDIRR